IRTLEVKEARAGLNRVWWDLRGEPSTEVKLRTPPTTAPDFRLNPDGTRRFVMAGASRLSMLEPPGTYTVTLTANGQAQSQDLVARKDPNSAGTEADIEAQTRAMRAVRDQINKTADLINRAESVRAQLGNLKTFLGDDAAAKELMAAADDLDKKIVGVEERL